MPDMTDIIAAALAEHEAGLDTSGDCHTGYCTCNQKVPYVDQVNHQARAVAAALETAGYGQVAGEKEWGFTGPRGYISGPVDEDEARIVGAQPGRTLVSRTVTAWKKEA